MGQFSWLDCINKTQVLDNFAQEVYLLVPQEFGGGHIEEHCYDGYGNFGEHDVYDLVAEWNKSFIPEMIKRKGENRWVCSLSDDLISDAMAFYNGDTPECETRIIGILLACYDDDNASLPYPIKITHDKNAVYEECKPSLADPNQGWLTSEDCDENFDWEEL